MKYFWVFCDAQVRYSKEGNEAHEQPWGPRGKNGFLLTATFRNAPGIHFRRLNHFMGWDYDSCSRFIFASRSEFRSFHDRHLDSCCSCFARAYFEI